MSGTPGQGATENVFILIDCMNSGLPPKRAKDDPAKHIQDRRAAYEDLFQMRRQRFHKIVYVKSPSADFWEIQDQKTLQLFMPMAKYAEDDG